jgi:cell division protein FtsB
MAKIRNRFTAVVIILLGLLIATPALFADNPGRGQRQQQRTTQLQQPRHRFQNRRLKRQNRMLRHRNRRHRNTIRRLLRGIFNNCHADRPQGHRMGRR